jgi:monoterpene epsilon-lactone hydrolase
VNVEQSDIGGVKVSIYTPKDVAPRNRKRVAMMFNSDAIGIILSAIGKMNVVSVHYMPTSPKGNADIVAVYRSLLQSYKPSQIAWVSLSGGCQFGGNTAMWLPEQKLPFPGAMALMTCAGGRMPGDTRNTMNGLDVQLSDFTAFRAGNPQTAPPPAAKQSEPQSEILNAPVIPKGFPPSYLLAGTRDMSLSHTVILHRRLRHAGVEADLNIFEGMWHGFNMEPDLPETRDAIEDLVSFLDRHLAS